MKVKNKTNDKVDPAVGFILKKKVSDKVTKGETLIEIHHHKKQEKTVAEIMSSLKKEIKISTSKVKAPKLVYEIKEVRG